jgi:hypothetical protein
VKVEIHDRYSAARGPGGEAVIVLHDDGVNETAGIPFGARDGRILDQHGDEYSCYFGGAPHSALSIACSDVISNSILSDTRTVSGWVGGLLSMTKLGSRQEAWRANTKNKGRLGTGL